MNNRPIHFEIQADDAERAKKFYENSFGWKIEKATMPDIKMDYWMIMTGKGPGINGGLYKRSDNPWRKVTTFDCTIQVSDIDKVIAAIKNNGGKIQPWEGKEKWEMKDLGWFSRAVDSEGNMFGLLQPTEWKANLFKNFFTKLLTQTNNKLTSISLLLLRCTVGVVLFLSGVEKLFGWFGGIGVKMSLYYYAQAGIPAWLSYVSMYTEFIGGLLLIIGLFARPAAFAIMINMLVATVLMWPNGFLVSAAWPFSLMVSAIIIQLIGPMNYSVDFLLARE